MSHIFLFSLWVLAHPMHVSLTGMEYFADKGKFEVFVKLNYDDFVLDYRYSVNDDQNFNASGEIDTSVVMVNKYLNDKIQIFAGDKKIEGKLTHIESAEGELKMFMLYDYRERTNSIKIKNMILTDLYKDQCNLLIFRYNYFEEGVKLTPEKTEQTFKVEQD